MNYKLVLHQLVLVITMCPFVPAEEFALPLATTSSEYQAVVESLTHRNITELNRLATADSPQVALNASWALASKALGRRLKNDRIFRPAVKQFAANVQRCTKCVPPWLDKIIREESQLEGGGIGFAVEFPSPKVCGNFLSLDEAVDTNSPRMLDRIVMSNRFPIGIEPTGKDVFISFAISEPKELAVRHVHPRDEVGGYVVACDLEGVRWIQRTFHAQEARSGSWENSARAQVVIDDEIVWLFGASKTEIVIESFELDTGKPLSRFNSNFF